MIGAALKTDTKVLIIDDVLATGGTAEAAIKLSEEPSSPADPASLLLVLY